jgi:hypothetical protein
MRESVEPGGSNVAWRRRGAPRRRLAGGEAVDVGGRFELSELAGGVLEALSSDPAAARLVLTHARRGAGASRGPGDGASGCGGQRTSTERPCYRSLPGHRVPAGSSRGARRGRRESRPHGRRGRVRRRWGRRRSGWSPAAQACRTSRRPAPSRAEASASKHCGDDVDPLVGSSSLSSHRHREDDRPRPDSGHFRLSSALVYA